MMIVFVVSVKTNNSMMKTEADQGSCKPIKTACKVDCTIGFGGQTGGIQRDQKKGESLQEEVAHGIHDGIFEYNILLVHFVPL